MLSSLADLIDRHRLIVCAGAGGVGKTTLAAALALGAAIRGRRVAVITIDPARALARAFGSTKLDWSAERVQPELVLEHGATLRGTLEATMFNQKRAWDELIRRHASTPELAQRVFDNPFYQKLSTRFAGSSEYAAIEHLSALHDSGRYDLIVLDTPPAAHAFDFVRAPERTERFLDAELVAWLRAGRLAIPSSARRFAAHALRWTIARLERATGRRSLSEMAALLELVEEMRDDLRRRSTSSRELLQSRECAFVLITIPERHVLDQSDAMLDTARDLGIPLRGVIVNRAHLLSSTMVDTEVNPNETLLDELRKIGGFDAEIAFIRTTWLEARALDRAERAQIAAFLKKAPSEMAIASIRELSHEVHSLAALIELSRDLLGPEPSAT